MSSDECLLLVGSGHLSLSSPLENARLCSIIVSIRSNRKRNNNTTILFLSRASITVTVYETSTLSTIFVASTASNKDTPL